MKEERLKELLSMYYRGETKDTEEAELKEFFSEGEVPEGYETERDIFSYYSDPLNAPEPSEDFRRKITKSIDDFERGRKFKFYRKRLIFIIGSAAAVILITVSLIFLLPGQASEDTFSDPQLAYAETMKILNEVSVKLKKGTHALEPVSRVQSMSAGINSFDRSAEMISKNLQRIKLLNDLSASDKQDEKNKNE